MTTSLRQLLDKGGHFQGYTYAYPHKTAYRELKPNRPLRDLWLGEDKEALFLYVHVPFCEMRCGFCNLFTMTHPGGSLVQNYLEALERQSEAIAEALGPGGRFARLALGGGTPTFLSIAELQRLFMLINRFPLKSSTEIPKAIEVSPTTVDDEKVAFLKEQGITRVSVGIQSFLETETRALGRAQRVVDARQTLGKLAPGLFRCLNIDLIYGIEGQTPDSWRHSLVEALEFAPQEIYIYPLYVRPLTQLGNNGKKPPDTRIVLYREAREFLLTHGYNQISMRLFRSNSYAPPEGPVYCCQEDGMVGMGPGARSYTGAVHYSSEYAVGRAGVVEVIQKFNKADRADFAMANYGFELDDDERRRRYVIKSVLRAEGLDLAAYRRAFLTDAWSDFPQLAELGEDNLAEWVDGRLKLTPSGMELSDVIGPWLWSKPVRERMEDFPLK